MTVLKSIFIDVVHMKIHTIFQRKLLAENEDEVGCAFTSADGIIVNESSPGSPVKVASQI